MQLRYHKIEIFQYMSAIFYHDEEQRMLAEKSLEKRSSETILPIYSSIQKAGEFYEAEE